MRGLLVWVGARAVAVWITVCTVVLGAIYVGQCVT